MVPQNTSELPADCTALCPRRQNFPRCYDTQNSLQPATFTNIHRLTNPDPNEHSTHVRVCLRPIFHISIRVEVLRSLSHQFLYIPCPFHSI
jgi:hypothetical protein